MNLNIKRATIETFLIFTIILGKESHQPLEAGAALLLLHLTMGTMLATQLKTPEASMRT